MSSRSLFPFTLMLSLILALPSVALAQLRTVPVGRNAISYTPGTRADGRSRAPSAPRGLIRRTIQRVRQGRVLQTHLAHEGHNVFHLSRWRGAHPGAAALVDTQRPPMNPALYGAYQPGEHVTEYRDGRRYDATTRYEDNPVLAREHTRTVRDTRPEFPDGTRVTLRSISTYDSNGRPLRTGITLYNHDGIEANRVLIVRDARGNSERYVRQPDGYFRNRRGELPPRE